MRRRKENVNPKNAGRGGLSGPLYTIFLAGEGVTQEPQLRGIVTVMRPVSVKTWGRDGHLRFPDSEPQ